MVQEQIEMHPPWSPSLHRHHHPTLQFFKDSFFKWLLTQFCRRSFEETLIKINGNNAYVEVLDHSFLCRQHLHQIERLHHKNHSNLQSQLLCQVSNATLHAALTLSVGLDMEGGSMKLSYGMIFGAFHDQGIVIFSYEELVA